MANDRDKASGKTKPLTTVLVATDLSPDGDRAARRAATLPYADRATLTVLHVLRARIPRPAEAVVRGAARRALDVTAAKIRGILRDRGLAGVTVRTRLGRGHAAPEIGRAAAATGAELIVVGRGGRAPAMLGSTAERVVRLAGRPVLIAGIDVRVPYRRGLIGYDFSGESFKAARLLARVGGTAIESVVVVNAQDDPYRGIPSAFIDRRREAGQGSTRDALVNRIRFIQRAIAPLGAVDGWRVAVRDGDPRRVIERLASRNATEIIALGSVGKGRVRRLVLGSVSEWVMRHARADVLVVPRLVKTRS